MSRIFLLCEHECHGMARSSYTCDGCGLRIERAMDLEKLEGAATPSWRCGTCETTVPSVVAERIKHQR